MWDILDFNSTNIINILQKEHKTMMETFTECDQSLINYFFKNKKIKGGDVN